MCGIAGFVHHIPDPDAAVQLAAMLDALAHRGPDARGFYLQLPERSPKDLPLTERLPPGIPPGTVPTWGWTAPCPPSGPQVGLANRRLAIVDRAGGRQPVFNERGTVIAVFNGELYNYRKLQLELRVRGHRLASEADTEIIVHLYEDYGIDGLLERIEGMFAFALWDQQGQVLYLVRDRIGEKPLYYSHHGGDLLFASESKGLLSTHRVPRQLDLGSTARYLLYESVPTPRSIYSTIQQIEPGCYVEYRAGQLRQRRYWNPPDPETLATLQNADVPDTDRLSLLEQRIIDAVEARLMGEVPLGALLSGGLDSGLVTAIMARSVPRLHTFSVGFRERSFDESEPAALVAQHLGTTHHALTFTADQLPPLLDQVQGWMDEPFADGSLVPTTVLARWVREHGIIVALSGDGGDEAFAGYPTYLAHRLDALWDRTPARLARLCAQLMHKLPSSFENISLDFKVRRVLAGLEERGVRRHAAWMSGLLPGEMLEVLTPEARLALADDDLFGELEPVARAIDGHSWPDYAQIQDLLSYLPDDLLVKMDRASMSVGLEVRPPLLDPGVITAGLGLPPHLKVSRWRTKVALRRIGRKWLPPAILERPKKGFGMPTAHWLRDLPVGLIEAWLAPPSGAAPLFDTRVVRRWLAEHRAGARDRRKQLWPILMFEQWRKGPWGP